MLDSYHHRIPELLRSRGWTKADLAKRMGITEVGVTRILHDRDVTLGMLERAALALDVPLWELLATRQQVLVSASSVRQDVLCPQCGRRIGLHIGVACEAMHLSRRLDGDAPTAPH